MRTGSRITYDSTKVALSIGIAVVAATTALVIAYRVRSRRHVALASVVIAGAVCGMHYTAMAATRVEHIDMDRPITGADPLTLSLTVCVAALTVLAIVIFLALGGVTDAGAFDLVRPRRPAARRAPPPARVRTGRRPNPAAIPAGPTRTSRARSPPAARRRPAPARAARPRTGTRSGSGNPAHAPSARSSSRRVSGLADGGGG